jgi:glycine betaine/choline ABC-type transport system substrate-binding protein
LEDAGLRVARKDPVQLDRSAYLDALAKGDFQLIPDFSRELVTHVLDGSTAVTSATPTSQGTSATNDPITVDQQLVTVRGLLPDTITVGNPALAEARTVIACNEATVTANKDTTFVLYSSLVNVAGTIRFGGSPAWMADEAEGYPAFQRLYGGTYKAVETIPDADLEAALSGGKVDCVAIDSMNPLITTQRLTILQDDKALTRPNAAVPLLNSTIATADVISALGALNTKLTSAKLNQMLNQVVAGGTDAVTVANAFIDTLDTTTETTTA